MISVRDIGNLERELARKGYEEGEENEFLCTRKWEKSFEYQGKVYHGRGRLIYTIWDYTCEMIYIKDPLRYEGSAVMAINGFFSLSFKKRNLRPDDLEQMVKDFLDGKAFNFNELIDQFK